MIRIRGGAAVLEAERMPVYVCQGCDKLISLSILPGGNPAAADPR